MLLNKKPEIMSPIKNWASLEACKDYADAVYFGVSDLSLRARTNSLTLEDIPKFVSKCHSYGLKAYMTINSVIYNNNLKKAEILVKKAKQSNVDAIIVWDLAVIEMAKKEKIPFPSCMPKAKLPLITAKKATNNIEIIT